MEHNPLCYKLTLECQIQYLMLHLLEHNLFKGGYGGVDICLRNSWKDIGHLYEKY